MNFISLNSQFLANFSFLTLFKCLFILFLIIINIFVIIKELEINKFSKDQPKYLSAGFFDSTIIRTLKTVTLVSAGVSGAITSAITIVNTFTNKDKQQGLDAISELQKQNQEMLADINTINRNWNDVFTGVFTQMQTLKREVSSVNENLESLLAKNQTFTNQIKNFEELAKTRDSDIKNLSKLWEEYNSVNLNDTQREIARQKFESQLKKVSDITANSKTTAESVTENSNNLCSDFENFDIKKSFIGSDLLEAYENLNGISQFAVSLMLINYGVINAVINIIFILYGDYLINKFQLDKKYPKVARIIALRKKFQRYYLFLSFFFIIFSSLVEIFCSIIILTF